MSYSKSKCQRIKVSVKANYKRLKAVLALRVKKLGLLCVALKLGKFSLFDNFFLHLADFWDLNNFSPLEFLDLDKFWPFDVFLVFNNFPYFSIDLSPSSILPNLSVISISLATSTYNNTVVFSIDVSGVAILLKP